MTVVKTNNDESENFDGIKARKIDYIERDAKKSGLIGWLKEDIKKRD